jgi:hypothetical protein
VLETRKHIFKLGTNLTFIFFSIYSYYDARDVTSSIPILTLSSPTFSVWSRHTRNSSKKPGRPKKEHVAGAAPPVSSTFSQEGTKRLAEELYAEKQALKKRKIARVEGNSQAKVEIGQVLQHGTVMMEQNNPLLQYTSQFYQMLSFLSDKHKMGSEERKTAFKLAYQHLCQQ